MGLLSLFLSFFFFAYYEKLDTYARLFLTQKPGTMIQEPHIFFDQRYSSVLSPVAYVGNLFLPEDPQFPALWVRGWLNGSPIPMKKYPREEAEKIFARHYASHYAQYVWLSESIHVHGGYNYIIQAEFNVLPAQEQGKIDEFHYIINGNSSEPLYTTFTLDLSSINRFIPGIGKPNSPYFIQWLCGNFFKLFPDGYKTSSGRVYWQWQNIHSIDQKIKTEWYAWYR